MQCCPLPKDREQFVQGVATAKHIIYATAETKTLTIVSQTGA